jgi:ribosomal protein S18 acetylase RimI-like enzyme
MAAERASSPKVRRAGVEDAEQAARLLHDFNTEFDDFTPGIKALTERLVELISNDDAIALLGGDGPDGIVVLRFRPSLWTQSIDAYLEELYVAPARRGEGIGRALLDAALEVSRERGAGNIQLGTSTDDVEARSLYESAGFTNREGNPDGPVMLFYERDL